MFGCRESGGIFFSCYLGLIFQSIFLLIVTQPKPTLPTVAITDLAVAVDAGTNHC
jgi:hypothetical protein